MQPDESANPTPTLAERLRHAPGTVAIVVACVGAYAYTAWKGDPNDALSVLRFGASERSHVWRGQYWRLVTPMFLHGGLLHLGMNMFFGSTWNMAVERAIGTARFLALYLLSGIFATCASLLLHDGISVGASGAMFGMVGVVVALMYRTAGSFRRFANNPGVRSLLFSIAIWIAIGFSSRLHLDNWAHLGGFTFGALLGYVVTERARPAGEPVQDDVPHASVHLVHWAMALTLLAFAVFAACKRWPRQHAQIGAYEAYQGAVDALVAGDDARARAEVKVAVGYDPDVSGLFYETAIRRAVELAKADDLGEAEHLMEGALAIGDPRGEERADAEQLLAKLRAFRGADGAPSPSESTSP